MQCTGPFHLGNTQPRLTLFKTPLALPLSQSVRFPTYGRSRPKFHHGEHHAAIVSRSIMREDALSLITREFKAWGVKFNVDHTGSNHYKLTWQATPDKEQRTYFIAKTPGDGRGTLNARADVRRLFKQDNIPDPRDNIKAPKTTIAKALALPVSAPQTESDHIAMLRGEVADLSELVLELAASLGEALKKMVAPPPPEHSLPITNIVKAIEHATPSTSSVRAVKAIDLVGEAWSSTAALARDMGLPANIAYRKLYYLMRQGKLEMQGDRWRKKPVEPEVVKKVCKKTAAVIPITRRKRAVNGHAAH